MLTQKQKRSIEKICYRYYKSLNSTHNTWHLKNTVRLALYIAKKEKANVEICKYASMLHQFHDTRKAEKMLNELGVDTPTRKQLVHCVYSTSSKTVHNARTKEAKVVYDADKLQVMGAVGLSRQMYDFAKYKYPKDTVQQILKNVRLEQNKIYKSFRTKTARKLAKEHYKFALKFFKYASVIR